MPMAATVPPKIAFQHRDGKRHLDGVETVVIGTDDSVVIFSKLIFKVTCSKFLMSIKVVLRSVLVIGVPAPK